VGGGGYMLHICLVSIGVQERGQREVPVGLQPLE
jgi:hypothetical protein